MQVMPPSTPNGFMLLREGGFLKMLITAAVNAATAVARLRRTARKTKKPPRRAADFGCGSRI